MSNSDSNSGRESSIVELDNLSYRDLLTAIQRREPITWKFFKKDVSGFDQVTAPEWVQISLAPIFFKNDLAAVVHLADKMLDQRLNLLLTAVEQPSDGGQPGKVEYSAGEGGLIYARASWDSMS